MRHTYTYGMKNIKEYGEHVKEALEQSQNPTEDLLHLLHFRSSVQTPETVEEVKRLIDAGADLDATDGIGRDALCLSIWRGSTKIAKILIEAGADINKIYPGNGTALCTAAHWGRSEVMKILIEKGADVNAVAPINGKTSLHYMAARRGASMVKSLIKNGANVNARDNEGQTPLHIAAYNNNVNAARELIKAGADIEAVDRTGNRPLNRAVSNNLYVIFPGRFDRKEVSKFLIESGADPTTVFGSLQDFKNFFNGDLSWVPEHTMQRLIKIDRSNKVFGRG